MKGLSVSTRGHHLLALVALALAFVLVLLPVEPAGGAAASERTASGRASSEVMHWWLAPSEAAALATIRRSYEAKGHVWAENIQPGRTVMRHALVERLVGGVPPLATLWQAGSEFPQLARLDMLHDVDPVARRQDWDAHLLPAVRTRVKVDGRYLFAPTNIHGDNWAFFNARLLARHRIAAPRTMPEAIAAMEALDRAGVPAVALGGQPWEVGVAFTGIMLGYLSREQYERLYRHHDVRVLDEPEARAALAAFDTFRRLAARTRPHGDWSVAARAVARGEAGFQILGDYAKAEMVRTGARVGRDIGCLITSPRETGLLLVIDGFVFPLDRGAPRAVSHLDLAEAIMDRRGQAEFSRIKGALPARIDALPVAPDACEAELLSRLRQPQTVLGDPLGALGPERVGAFNAAVHGFFADRTVTREAAARRMAAGLSASRP